MIPPPGSPLPSTGDVPGHGVHGRLVPENLQVSRVDLVNDFLVKKGIGAAARGLILMQHAEGSLRQYQTA